MESRDSNYTPIAEELCKELFGTWYAIGNLREIVSNDTRVQVIDVWDEKCKGFETYRIKPETKSISFEGMLDCEGEKIFASLSEDGKGGDILKAGKMYQLWISEGKTMTAQIREGLAFPLFDSHDDYDPIGWSSFKVIGIQK